MEDCGRIFEKNRSITIYPTDKLKKWIYLRHLIIPLVSSIFTYITLHLISKWR